jgi:hypothetical protein
LLVGGDGRDLLIVGTRSVRIVGNADDLLIAEYPACPVRRSDGDPLDDVPCHLATSAIVEPRGPQVGVAGQVLHVLQSTDRLHPK